MHGKPRHGAGTALILAATIVAAAAPAAHEILYLSEGRVYRGDVVDARPHGEGTMIWPSGATYTGTWEHGARHGAGVERIPNGSSRRCT